MLGKSLSVTRSQALRKDAWATFSIVKNATTLTLILPHAANIARHASLRTRSFQLYHVLPTATAQQTCRRFLASLMPPTTYVVQSKFTIYHKFTTFIHE